MALQFKAGDVVRQIMPEPVDGVIARFVFDETSGDISYIVENTDVDGNIHSRSFSESQIALKTV